MDSEQQALAIRECEFCGAAPLASMWIDGACPICGIHSQLGYTDEMEIPIIENNMGNLDD